MTTELEQEFYDTFGIEPKKLFSARQGINTDAVLYPDITSEKLLEMICIINEFISMFNWKQIRYISTFEIETLKENILKDLIWILSNECNDVTKKQLKQQIQQLFKD